MSAPNPRGPIRDLPDDLLVAKEWEVGLQRKKELSDAREAENRRKEACLAARDSRERVLATGQEMLDESRRLVGFLPPGQRLDIPDTVESLVSEGDAALERGDGETALACYKKPFALAKTIRSRIDVCYRRHFLDGVREKICKTVRDEAIAFAEKDIRRIVFNDSVPENGLRYFWPWMPSGRQDKMPTPDRLVSGMDDPEAAGRWYAELWNLSAEGASCRIPGPEHRSTQVSSAIDDLVRATDRLLEVEPDCRPDTLLYDAVSQGIQMLKNELAIQKKNEEDAIHAWKDWEEKKSTAVALILATSDFGDAEVRARAEPILTKTARAVCLFSNNNFPEAAEQWRFLASRREKWDAIARRALADELARRLAAGDSEFIWNHLGWIKEIDSFDAELASRCHKVFDAESERRRREAESERCRREAEDRNRRRREEEERERRRQEEEAECERRRQKVGFRYIGGQCGPQ